MGPYQTLRADTLWVLLLVLFWVFCIFSKTRNRLIWFQNIGYVLFLEKKAPARNAPVVVRGGSSENKRMSPPKIEEPPRNTLWKQIIMKLIYYKETKIIRYSTNLDPNNKYFVFFYPNLISSALPSGILPFAVSPHHRRRVWFLRLVSPKVEDF